MGPSRSELVQVETAHPAGDVGEALRHQRPVPGLEPGQTHQQTGQPASSGHGRRHVAGHVGTHFELLAPRQHDPEAVDVVRRLAGVKAVGTTGVVADHATEGAPGMGGRVGAEREAVLLRGPAQVVQHHPRFNPGHPPVRVDLGDPRHVARHVDDDRLVARLPGQAGPGPPGQERRPRLGGQAGRRPDVVVVDGEDDAQGYVAVVRRIAGVGGPGRGVEADLAAHRAGQRRPQGGALSFFELAGLSRHPRPGYTDRTSWAMSSPASVGFSATFTPARARASILAWAVPLLPEMMAPAWPMRRPGGAVTPAM